MKDVSQSEITADVRLAENLDRLIVTPRYFEQTNSLSRILRELLAEKHIRRSAVGISVSAAECERLLLLDPFSQLVLNWSAEALMFARNRQRIHAIYRGILDQTRKVRRGGAGFARSLLMDIQRLEVLDDHQLISVASMTIPDGIGLCLFDEQGAGKTVTTIYAYDVLVERDEVDFALVISPKSMVSEWLKDFSKFQGDIYRVTAVYGTRRDKLAAIASRPDVIVTNFETAVSMEDELRATLRSYNHRAILVVDESFFVKNLDARRTKAIRRLREWCGRAFVLCGTPAPNSPQDLIQQFNIVDFGMTFDGVEIPEDKEAARDVVKEAVERKGLFIRNLKKDVLPDLPVKKFNRLFLRMQPEQLRLYTAALQSLAEDLSIVDDKEFHQRIASFLARKSALLQICSNPVRLVDNYVEIPAKILALDDLLETILILNREKVVLWSFYTASIDALYERYSMYTPVRYDGSVSSIVERRESVRRFQEDDETMLFLGNPAAAGAGLTLHRARFAIYESMSNQAAHYLQSLDRIHRRGQRRDVEYIILLCQDTIEVNEFDRLIEKERAAQRLLGDEVEPAPTREMLLNEILELIRRIDQHGG